MITRIDFKAIEENLRKIIKLIAGVQGMDIEQQKAFLGALEGSYKVMQTLDVCQRYMISANGAEVKSEGDQGIVDRLNEQIINVIKGLLILEDNSL